MPPTKRTKLDNGNLEKKKPSPENVVKLILGADQFHEEQKEGKFKKSGPGMKTYYIASCPRSHCRDGRGHTIEWEAKTGYGNPYRRLCKCFGSEEMLLEAYDAALDKSTGSRLDIIVFDRSTPEEKTIYMWIELVVKRNLPLSAVEDQLFRKCVKHNSKLVSAKRIKKILFAMVELVEKAVGKELRDAGCGALMHDAWTKVDVHYIGIFACYMRDIKMTHD